MINTPPLGLSNGSPPGPASPDHPPHEGRVALARLTRRAEFLLAAKAPSVARGAVVVQGRDRTDGVAVIRLGFTATKKVGGSVVRNRAKRRLREVARRLVPEHGRVGTDYVFIARSGTPDRAWERLLDDVRGALQSLAAGEGRARR